MNLNRICVPQVEAFFSFHSNIKLLIKTFHSFGLAKIVIQKCILGFLDCELSTCDKEGTDARLNDDESDEEYLDVVEDDHEKEEESCKTINSQGSSTKPQFANFSVLSLLGRKSPAKERENKILEGNCLENEKYFPCSEEDEEGREGGEASKDDDSDKQFSQVWKKEMFSQVLNVLFQRL